MGIVAGRVPAVVVVVVAVVFRLAVILSGCNPETLRPSTAQPLQASTLDPYRPTDHNNRPNDPNDQGERLQPNECK